MLDGCELTKALLSVAELSAEAEAEASEALVEPPASLVGLGASLLMTGLKLAELSEAGTEDCESTGGFTELEQPELDRHARLRSPKRENDANIFTKCHSSTAEIHSQVS